MTTTSSSATKILHENRMEYAECVLNRYFARIMLRLKTVFDDDSLGKICALVYETIAMTCVHLYACALYMRILLCIIIENNRSFFF